MVQLKIVRLVADSGGTNTDWIGISSTGETVAFTTESYHPLRINEDFICRQITFWKQYDVSECFLHFYGAGCLKAENQKKMETFLTKIGFSEMLVESDLYAAARATDAECEMVAICGTGSVLVRVDHGQLLELRGGLGWDKGDEGGGYYFGKLLLERLEENKEKYLEIRNVISKWKAISELNRLKTEAISKEVYSQLPIILRDYINHPFVSSVHMENIQLFFEKYTNNVESIGFVGSYSFFLQDYFKLVCNQRKIKATSFVQRPIKSFANKL